jgi:hypothetical protein
MIDEKTEHQVHVKRNNNNRVCLAFRDINALHRMAKNQNAAPLINHKTSQLNQIEMDVILTIAYVLCFIVVFWIFFKTVNYFEKI